MRSGFVGIIAPPMSHTSASTASHTIDWGQITKSLPTSGITRSANASNHGTVRTWIRTP